MKKLCIIIATVITTTAHAATVSACVESYEGLIPYNVAVAGCQKGILIELTAQEYNRLYDELTPAQVKELTALIME